MMPAHKIVAMLEKKNYKIAFAESCTGGMLAAKITSVPGSSKVFEIGVITYANSFKEKILKVSKDTLDKFGAVSFETAEEMVKGLKALSNADICIAVTGIAGPGGGSEEKPVGLVYISYLWHGNVIIEKNIFQGTRNKIRLKTVNHVMNKIIKILEEPT